MKIIKFEQIKSTNTWAKDNLNDLDDKTVISADFQTEGIGQFDRKWINLAGENVFLSIVLKPSKKFDDKYSNLTNYLASKVCEILIEYGLKPEIKYPNDILINGKKVAGILAQAVTQGKNFKGMVLGVGINLNVKKNDLIMIDQPITSISAEIKKNINKEIFEKKLLDKFFDDYDKFLNE